MKSRKDRTLAETLVADERYSPLEALVSAERRAILRQCRRKLSARQTRLLRLRYEKDLTFEEIAEMFQRSRSAVMQMHNRALAIMLAQLGKRRICAIGHIL